MQPLGEDKVPMKMNDTWVAPNASVIGDVLLNDEVSIWYRAVIRGDANKVRIGAVSNVQEKVVITTAETLESGFPALCEIGQFTSIGAGSTLKSCTVGDNVQIGEGCVILDGAVVEDKVILEPGSVLYQNARVPSGEKWAGCPAEFVAKLTEEEQAAIVTHAEAISTRAQECAMQYLPLPGDP